MSPAPQVLAHLVDVHCHPTDAPSLTASTIESPACTLCAMSTQAGDQSKVAALARAHERLADGADLQFELSNLLGYTATEISKSSSIRVCRRVVIRQEGAYTLRQGLVHRGTRLFVRSAT